MPKMKFHSGAKKRFKKTAAGKLKARPFDREFAPDMHERIVNLIGQVALYVQRVEAAWLWSRDPGVVTVTQPGGERFPLRD
jgi:hypothetical protein